MAAIARFSTMKLPVLQYVRVVKSNEVADIGTHSVPFYFGVRSKICPMIGFVPDAEVAGSLIPGVQPKVAFR